MKLVHQKPITQKQTTKPPLQKRKRIPMQVNKMGLLTPRGPTNRPIGSTRKALVIPSRQMIKRLPSGKVRVDPRDPNHRVIVREPKTTQPMTMVHQKPPAQKPKGLITRMMEGIFTRSNRYVAKGIKVGEKVGVIKK